MTIKQSGHTKKGKHVRIRESIIRVACCAACFGLLLTSSVSFAGPTDRPQSEERLSFQAFDPWRPDVNLNADVAMVYGIDETLPQRIKTYVDAGYIPHVMSGVSWGEYAEYYYGDFDGINHVDEVQKESSGNLIGHGKDNYYVCPSISYGKFLCKGVKRAIDAGAVAIHMEEPEFWVRSGWSEGFKREWQAYYHEPWQDPTSSPDAQYRASKLKYYLYRRTLQQIFDYVHKYGKEVGRDVRCYVPTHSMINYANWGIVSPESSLLDVGCDGYIAQVWTGTARTPNVYEGRKRERTFETAFLEYGAMQNLVRASGRRVWYLNDPIEDNSHHSWHDYRTNWESTLIASLLQPEVWHYEIMPWPHRIFEHNYPSKQPVSDDTPRIPIPPAYHTELQGVISAMGDMKQPVDKVQWTHAGTKGVGVLVSDTMMFQRYGPDRSDGELGSFFGLSLPLLMHGIPVEPVQIETAELDHYRVLLLTYEGQKPPKPEFHDALAKWVRNGGTLIVIDDDTDPYNKVREWWNSNGNDYATPRDHLFEKLGLDPNKTGMQRVGKGIVNYVKQSPAALTHRAEGADQVRKWVQEAMQETGVEWHESNAFVLRRGPYIIAAGLGDPEDASRGEPVTLTGKFIPLFDANMPVVNSLKLVPGTRALLVDLDRVPETAGIVAAACRANKQKVTNDLITFQVDGLEDSPGIVAINIDKAPQCVTIDGNTIAGDAYDYDDGILRIRFTNHAVPQQIAVTR